MKILIFGANSFIARNFIFSLLDKDNISLALFDYQEKHLDNYDFYRKINPLVRDEWKTIDLNCDLIYYFTGMTGTEKGFEQYEQFLLVNELSLLHLLSECRDQKTTAKIIFPSTRLVYHGKETPIKENDDKEPKTIYSINKLACEEYLSAYSNSFGIKYCILRICVPFGSLINTAPSYGTAEFFISKGLSGQNLIVYGNGENRRTFTFIGDLCSILLRVGREKRCVNDVYNVGGIPFSLRQLAEAVSKKYNVGIDYIPWPELSKKIESGTTVFDSAKIERIIGNINFTSLIDWIFKTED